MLDATPARTADAEAADWRQALTWADIVAFRFPCSPAERESGYRPKTRPCVVLDVVGYLGERYVTLAYGTTSDSRANRGYEVKVTRPEALARVGLDRPTRFVGSRRITVSVKHAGFCLGERGTPVLGRLTGEELDRLNAVRARICAEADIAAERHAERRRRTRRRKAGLASRASRPPVIVVRKPRARATTAQRPAGPSG